MDKAVTGTTAVIGTILSILTFYYSAYLPMTNGQNTPEPVAATVNPADIAAPIAEAIKNVAGSQPLPAPESQPAPEPLTATIILDETWGEAPATFDFEAEATGGEASYSYSWDFGDYSEEDYGQFVSHEFEDAGDYYVELTVTDAEGQTASDGIDITVDEPYIDEEYTDEDEEYTE